MKIVTCTPGEDGEPKVVTFDSEKSIFAFAFETDDEMGQFITKFVGAEIKPGTRIIMSYPPNLQDTKFRTIIKQVLALLDGTKEGESADTIRNFLSFILNEDENA